MTDATTQCLFEPGNGGDHLCDQIPAFSARVLLVLLQGGRGGELLLGPR